MIKFSSFRFTVLVLVFLLTQACATSPTGRSQLTLLPEAQMQQMGLQAFDSMKKETPISKNTTTNRFVECIATDLIQVIGGEWEVVVFEDGTPNAFALPGGKIGVHTGMLKIAENQDQLAAVIGHEIGHVIARHGNERASQNMAAQTGMQLIQAVAAPASQLGQLAMGALGVGAKYGVLLPFSRTHESEADLLGMEYMAKAGFDPREASKLWMNMSKGSNGQAPPEFMSTHPAHQTRIDALTAHLSQAMPIYQAAQNAGKRPNCDRFRR